MIGKKKSDVKITIKQHALKKHIYIFKKGPGSEKLSGPFYVGSGKINLHCSVILL